MREIAEASARFQREIESERRHIVNVNVYEPEEDAEVPEIELHSANKETERGQVDGLKALKEGRDNEEVERCLAAVRAAAEGGENTMYPVIEAVRAYASVGEISRSLQEVYSSYRETLWL